MFTGLPLFFLHATISFKKIIQKIISMKTKQINDKFLFAVVFGRINGVCLGTTQSLARDLNKNYDETFWIVALSINIYSNKSSIQSFVPFSFYAGNVNRLNKLFGGRRIERKVGGSWRGHKSMRWYWVNQKYRFTKRFYEMPWSTSICINSLRIFITLAKNKFTQPKNFNIFSTLALLLAFLLLIFFVSQPQSVAW